MNGFSLRYFVDEIKNKRKERGKRNKKNEKIASPVGLEPTIFGYQLFRIGGRRVNHFSTRTWVSFRVLCH